MSANRRFTALTSQGPVEEARPRDSAAPSPAAVLDRPAETADSKVHEAAEVTQCATRESFPGPRWSLAFVGLLGYIIFEYLRVPAQFPLLRPLALGKVTLGICAIGLLFEARSRASIGTSSRLLQIMMAFVVLVGFVGTCLADYQEEGWDGFSDLIKWVVTAFLIAYSATSSWRLRICVLVMLILNLKMAQAVIRNYSAWREAGGDDVVLATKGIGAGSVGFFANSGDFGAAMAVVWGITAMLLLSEQRKMIKIMLFICFAAFSAAIVASGSRGAFLAVCVAGLSIWLRKPSPKRIGALIMAFLLMPAFYYILPEANKNRLRSLQNIEQDKTARIRMDLWRAGVDMFKDNPVIGVGPGNFSPQYDYRYAGPDRNPIVSAPHSIYVQNLAELGLLGIVPLTIVWVGYFLVNRKTRIRLVAQGHQEGKSFEIAMTRGLDLAMIGYLVCGAFATLFYFPHMWVLVGFALGLHIAASRRPAASAYSDFAAPDTALEPAAR